MVENYYNTAENPVFQGSIQYPVYPCICSSVDRAAVSGTVWKILLNAVIKGFVKNLPQNLPQLKIIIVAMIYVWEIYEFINRLLRILEI